VLLGFKKRFAPMILDGSKTHQFWKDSRRLLDGTFWEGDLIRWDFTRPVAMPSRRTGGP
jgi:hypothetical protein